VTRALEGHSGGIHSVAFNLDGTLLASGSSDNTIKLWNVGSGELLHTLDEHVLPVTSVAFSPDGTLLASGSWDNTIKLWDVNSWKLLCTLEKRRYISEVYFPTIFPGVLSIAFSPDGMILSSGGRDLVIRLWDVASRQLLRSMGLRMAVVSVAFSSDGTLLASAAWNEIRLWDVASGKLIRILDKHSAHVNSVAFSPDGTLLASGSDGSTVKLWDAEAFADSAE